MPAETQNNIVKAVPEAQVEKAQGSEWDFKLTAVALTLAAFATRFWGLSHPDQVVFDEVHFGKVCQSLMSTKNLSI